MLFSFYFVVLLHGFFSFRLTFLYRSILIYLFLLSNFNVNISLRIRLLFALSTVIRFILGTPHRVVRRPQLECDQYRGGCTIVIEYLRRGYPSHSSAFGTVMEGNSGGPPFAPSLPPEDPRQ